MSSFSVLILAAGKGVRMKSALPKVLHSLGGIPLVERVCQTFTKLKANRIGVVVGHQGEKVKAHLKPLYPKIQYATQTQLNGSGGAVRQALSFLKNVRGDVIVACGDAPLISQDTFKSLLRLHKKEKNAATVLTAAVPNPKGYGRIIRKRNGAVARIVEELDARPGEKKINEVNTGTYCFNVSWLVKTVKQLKNNNAKKEYYLTDVLEILNRSGQRVGALVCEDYREMLGINSRADLALAHQVSFQRKAEALMKAGVTIIDPSSTFIDEDVKVGAETIIWPQTFIQQGSKIGSRCQIGPWSHIKRGTVENDAIIQASFVDSATIQKGARVGPFSRVRPKSIVGPGVHLGNFSEVKNTTLKQGSKVNHLSYLGDAKVGKNVNIGAGTITCNYDGIQKFPTVIQDHAFVGSNVNLVAPITLGAHSVVGAGSSLSQDVPAWALAVERAPSKIRKGWAKKKFKRGKKK